MQEVLISKIFNYTSTPTKNVEGQFWFNPSTNVLSRFNGTVWKPITVSSNDVAVLTDGSKVSLTNYLNTQIAALAEGIDSKQDKLSYYSETSGDTPSATISVANIKLDGNVAEGISTTASGNYSHAEGLNTTASGNYSHAEGSYTTASGHYSHTEGSHTTASGHYSHTEGYNATASGLYSHAEGLNTTASGSYSHVQGKYNIEDTNDKYADIIGNGTLATARSNAATVSWKGISWSQTDVRAGGTDQDSATYSLSALAEGKQDKLAFYREDSSTNLEASIQGADAFSIQDAAKGLILNNTNSGITIENGRFNAGKAVISLEANTWEDYSDAIFLSVDGEGIKLSDVFLIPQINNKQNSTDNSLATTNKTVVGAINEVNTALNTKANKLLYYSETSGDTPSATISVANIKLTGNVAEGNFTAASGHYSHAEGCNTTASGDYSHAEGLNTTALGDYSHAEGHRTRASGLCSHTEGLNTTASGSYSHVQGKYNIVDTSNKYANIIGNGSSSNNRSNAQTVSWNGISWSQTDVRAGGTDQDSAAHSLAAKQNATDNSLTTTNKTIVGAINEINSIFNVNNLLTPITDVKTITTTLENLITDTQYANKPGTILINPAITNTGAILVGENITDLNKAFPIYTDQPVTIAFKNINDFKVAGNIAGDKFNYIVSFGYIGNTNIVSNNLKITTTNGIYEIIPEGDSESMTLKLSKIS